MTRAALYIRVSSDKQAQEGDSIPAQRDALHKYAAEHSMTVAGEYLDDGISGTKSDRDALVRMLEDVEAGRVDIILVTKLDRLYRSIRHYLNMMEILDRHNVGWLAIWEPIYDTTTPQGRLIVNQMMSIAQFEAENTSQRVRQIQAYKVSQGEVISGSVPFGYRIEDKHLVPSDRAPDALRAFEAYAETGSLSGALAKLGHIDGLPRSPHNYKRMLRNTLYIGKKGDNEAFCEPIVPRDLWDTVQRLLPINIKRGQKRVYLFTGLITCAECGCHFASLARQKRGKEVRQYRCPRHFQRFPAQCHNQKVITESALEKYLLDHINELIGAVTVQIAEEQKKAPDHAAHNARIRRKIDRLRDLYVDEQIDMEEYRNERKRLESELIEPPQVVNVETLDMLQHTDIPTIYATLTDEEKRRFWRGIIKEIRFDSERHLDVLFV